MRLREFRVWLAGGSALAERLAGVCEVESVGDGDLPLAPPAHCLLVEGSWLLSRPLGEVEALLDACEASGVPRLLWIRDSPLDPAILDLGDSFDRAFTVDGDQVGTLAEAGFTAPSLLPGATALSAAAGRSVAGSARDIEVVWLGGWRPDWPAGWRERLSAVLLAAVPFGLSIHGVAEPGLLPVGLRGCMAAEDEAPVEEVFGRAKVVIAADPTVASPGAVPGVLFDAVACGAAAVSPHDRGVMSSCLWSLEPNVGPKMDLVPVVVDRRGSTAAIESLLSGPEWRERVVQRCRDLVARNHTYAHRVATIASALGHRVVP